METALLVIEIQKDKPCPRRPSITSPKSEIKTLCDYSYNTSGFGGGREGVHNINWQKETK